MFQTSQLVPLLAERGIHLSREQVYRLVTQPPQRLSMDTLAALCDILDVTPNDLIEVVCVWCGRLRPCYRRRADGNTYCITCYPRTARDCARCGQHRLVGAEWPIGPVCGTCYTYVRRNPGPCSGCGQLAALVGANSRGRPVCGPCAGWAGPAFACHGCGVPDMLEHGRCARCVLTTVTVTCSPRQLRKSAGSSASWLRYCWLPAGHDQR
jgi:DNA-binding Xre family transcriptional regulator